MRIEERDAREAFQKNLKRLLASSTYDQKTIAEKVGVSTSNVSDWIAGKAYPRIGPMSRLASLFNVPIESLVGRYEPSWKSYLIHAYEQGNLDERINACAALKHNYFPVGDDRELIGITKICLSQISKNLIDYKQATAMVHKYYEDSSLNGKTGCTLDVLNTCINAIASDNISLLDKIPFDDDITDNNSACLTLLQLTGQPFAPYVDLTRDELEAKALVRAENAAGQDDAAADG